MDARNVTCVDEAKVLLRNWREENVRQSDDVVDLWEELLADAADDLGEEKWMIVEQVCVAAMDTNRVDVLDICLKDLRANFDKDSLRVRRLLAMRAEMMEDYDRALAILDSILEEDEANSQARKRKVAIHVAQGDNGRAISELNRYVREFMNDGEAWMELCDLYVLEQDYAKAAFCCEELILQNPNNHLYYQKFADIKYTQGGFEHMELAKSYYSQAAKLNPDNMRALYGLLLTATQLLSSPKCTAQKKKDYQKSVNWAAKQVSSKYEAKLEAGGGGGARRGGGQQVPVGLLDGLLGQLQIQAPAQSSS